MPVTPLARPDVLGSACTQERRRIIPPKVFVGNIPFETTKEQLVELLSSVGEVRDAYLPLDRATGRPRGFAFVEFATQDEAAEAIDKFNEYELGGRKLRVNPAEDRPRPRTPPPAPRDFQSDFGRDSWSQQRPAKPKGSRRGLRGKKRSL